MSAPPKNVEFQSLSDNPEKWKGQTQSWAHRKHLSRKTKPWKDYVLHFLPGTGADKDYADIVAVTKEEQVVGNLFFGPHPNVPNAMEGAVEVDPRFRRQGIASAMYEWAEHLTGGKFAPATSHTPYAEALWQNPKRPFGKESTLALRVAARFAAKN